MSRSPERKQPLGNHLVGPTAAAERGRLLCSHPSAPVHRLARSAGDTAHNDTAVRLLQLGPQRCSGVSGPFTSPLSTGWKNGSGNYMAKRSEQMPAYAFLLCSTRLEATTLATTPVSSQPCQVLHEKQSGQSKCSTFGKRILC